MFDFVLEQFTHFLNGERCCKLFCETFRIRERDWFAEIAARYNIRARTCMYKGQKVLKLYKSKCIHYIEMPYEVALEPASQRDLYLLHAEGDFVNTLNEMQMSPDFLSYGGHKPTAPVHRFALGNLKQCMVKFNTKFHMLNNQSTGKLFPFKTPIMETIHRTRVLVINGDRTYDKSSVLPLFIIENCIEKQVNCKIICVEQEQLTAIYNSERLSEQLNEKIGETVAYQVHLQSRISEESNLIYTTPTYFLRVLMGDTPVNSFRHISHVIVNDIQQHDAYTDILLTELRTALQMHAHLKIILLSNASNGSEVLHYFGEGEEFFLPRRKLIDDKKSVKIFYIEDIRSMLNTRRNLPKLSYNFPPSFVAEIDKNVDYLERSLDLYAQHGTDAAFNSLLYMYKGEYISIDHRHTKHGMTAIILATRLNNPRHVHELLELNADPFLLDKENKSAFAYAAENNSKGILELLHKYCPSQQAPKACLPGLVDYNLLNNLLHLILTGPDWPVGNIVVIVPSYTHMLRLNFSILRHQIIGNLPQEVSIKLLHNHLDKEKLHDFLKSNFRDSVNIILATDIAETATFIKNITYVIDLARAERTVYNVHAMCNEQVFEWISKVNLESRLNLADCGGGGAVYCFRLLPKSIYETLPHTNVPELKTMPLDRVCLTVKLISQHTMVAEYLQRCIVEPPFLHVHHVVGFLKKIEVFDDLEEITWLGCRLIDVPVPCQLGKLLVMGILLQCIDPILTIVSFKMTTDPLAVPTDMDRFVTPFMMNIRKNLKNERNRFAEGKHSDHLLYLRLYAEWQNNQREDRPQLTLNDEFQFVYNGILEHIYEFRTQLVGNLRSAQLVHTTGLLSMHCINQKSNSWPIIKAALVAGLYPNICYIDTMSGRLKSARGRELMMHPESALRNLEVEPLNTLAKSYKAFWLVYGKETNNITCNSINYCTIILPVVIALFGGPSRLHPQNIFNDSNSPSNATAGSLYFIDELVCLQMNSVNAQLVFKTRQFFYSAYHNFLQNCRNHEKWRRICNTSKLFDTLEKVLLTEDSSKGLQQPDNVGLRPKAAPNKFLTTFNDFITWERAWNNDMTNQNSTFKKRSTRCLTGSTTVVSVMSSSSESYFDVVTDNGNDNGSNANINTLVKANASSTSVSLVTATASLSSEFLHHHQCATTNGTSHMITKTIGFKPKAFYLVSLSDEFYMNSNSNSTSSAIESMQVMLSEIIEPVLTTEKLTYIIMFSKLPDQLRVIALAKWNCGEFRLYECFRNNIPIYDLVETCLSNYIHLPTFNERRMAYQLEDRIGNIILDLFAYRINLLHVN